MPTTRPRYQVTETPDIAAALDDAAKRWPGEPRSRLLLRLVELGRSELAERRTAAVAARREAIKKYAGAFTDLYPPGYLADLRKDWPE